MGYDDDGDITRQQLYERFRQSLSRPASERYFDEDELVEIFDYAGDVDDTYVRIEVLCCGARLYPDSSALSDRRALLYLDEDDTDRLAGAFVADNHDVCTPIADIVKLEVNRPEPEHAAEALEFLISQYDHLSDEESIRFVDLAVDLDQYKWLVANLDILRTKCSFLPSLLFEVLTEADELGDNDTVIAIADELIEQEPFSVTYWSALFRGHARAGHEDDARAAFDYAKALATDNPADVDWLCETVFSFAPYLRREAIELLDVAIEKDPDEFHFTDIRCGLLMQGGDSAAAVQGIKDFLDRNPGDYMAVRRLLSTNARYVYPYLEAFYRAVPSGFGASAADEIVNQLHMQGAVRTLNDFITAYSAHECLSADYAAPWAESLFAMERYDDIVQLVQSLPSFDAVVNVPLKGTAFAVCAVISYMKKGMQEQADAFMAKTRPAFEAMLEGTPLPIRMAVRSVLNLYDTVGRHPASDKFFWEYHDPFRMGKL